MKKSIAVAVFAALILTIMAVPAFATIHPIVESFDCADEAAFAAHPLGDIADPPGQTPEYGSHSDQSTLRALMALTDDFTDFEGPQVAGATQNKLDGTCGEVGRP
ncbi:MAG: hypothetical protein GEU74_05325 [Nitriliruptorales bacterium]|nr:hypothetical protein [Nitriliruptorales bacterium]